MNDKVLEEKARGWLVTNGLEARHAPYLARFIQGLAAEIPKGPEVIGGDLEPGTAEEASVAVLKDAKFFALVTGQQDARGKGAVVRSPDADSACIALAVLTTTLADGGVLREVVSVEAERAAKELGRLMRPAGMPAPKVMVPGFTPPENGYLS